ncbi:DMT family transporter [Rhodospirillum centenum]|nr:multidrug efflux SMR transporter [Rhodospirillum centenum]
MSPVLMAYGALALAIVCEVAGTTFLQKSEQFTRPGPILLMVLFYAGSFYFLAQALKAVPLGIAYAVWAGVGIVLTAVIGAVIFRQMLDAAAILGIGLIVAGVVVIQIFSKSVTH